MASLKEIKTRISSVDSTKKITSAMKMVASAKLRKAQKNIEAFLPYEQKLNEMLNCFLSTEKDVKSIYTEQRDLRRVAIVAASSNSSLCGAFNSAIIKKTTQLIELFSQQLGRENIEVLSIGKKVADAVREAALLLRERHHLSDEQDDDFRIPSASDFMKMMDKTSSLMNNLLLGVA